MKKYRALHISDIHMSNNLPHAKVTDARGVTDRLSDQLALWARVFATAEKFRCEVIFIQGDLFDHSRTDAITLAETFRVLAQAPVPVLVVAGNHDGVNTRGERFTVEALAEVKGCSYMLTGKPFRPRSWLAFWPLEFSPLERTREALAAMPLTDDQLNILLMHNSVIGCTHGGWTCEDDHGLAPDVELCNRFDYVYSGHFHDEQVFGRRGNGRYLGAPMHHRFDDVGRRAGYWVIEHRSDGTRKEVFVDGGAPRFHTVSFTDKEARARLKTSTQPGDYVRVSLRCTHAKLVKRQPRVAAYVDKLIARGVRASWVHDPVYHHRSRIASVSDDTGVTVDTPRRMVTSYVDAVEVDTRELDAKALKRIGRDIFVSVEGQWRA